MAFKGQMKDDHQPYWELIERIITESDVVLEILDARLVEMSRNEEIERLVEEIERPLIFVVNKSDLTTKESLERQVDKLREKGQVIFINAKDPKSVKILMHTIKKAFKKHGKREIPIRGKFDPKPKFRAAKADIVVSVLGYPNVGKSSIINAICHKKKSKVSKKAGTTHGVHWIRVNDEMKILDSPGVIPLLRDDEIRYGLIGARDSERLKEPELVAYAVIKLFLKSNKKKFEEFYGIEIKDCDVYEIIELIGLKRGHLLSKGRVDENRTVNQIVRDWQHGNLVL